MFYVWDTETALNIYTNSITAPIDSVAISGNGNRIAYVANSVLRYGDRVSDFSGLISSNAVAGAHAPVNFSSDGRFLAYVRHPAQNFQTNLVYLYDFQTGTNILVSHSFDSFGPAAGISDSPAFSGDGRFIAYRSSAEDMVPGDSNGLPDVFLFDRLTGATTLVSVNRTGLASADNRSLMPVISGDGRTIVFQSWASDLFTSDLNQSSDLFAFKLTVPPVTDSDGDGMDDQWELGYFQTLARDGTRDLDGDGATDLFEFLTGTDPTDPKSLFRGEITFGAASGLPRVEWPVSPGKAYRIEFKDSLGDTNWQRVVGNVSIIKRHGYFDDPTGSNGQRYYRIVLDQSLSQ